MVLERRMSMAEYKRGSTGKEVKEIQIKLNNNGFYNGPFDGIFGGGTEAAVSYKIVTRVNRRP